ncbi:MAG: META domain-containing protein, partial [Gammaproteobacteria bacterium]|nr:META domain-containing protein [Gammaproteobacteria bacterium]
MIRCLPLLVLALAACTPIQPPADDPEHSAPAAADAASAPASAPATASLDAWHWRLSGAVDAEGNRIQALFANPDQPLQLDFGEGRLSVSGGCNRIGGDYEEEGGALRVGTLVQTQMACPQPLMDQDAAIAGLLEGELALAKEDSDPPRLELTATNGSRLSFTGAPTADTRFGGPGERMFLEV